MKTMTKLFSIAAIALCCSGAALAEQNTRANVAATTPAAYEEMVITAQRVTKGPALGAMDRAVLVASMKAESRKVLLHLMAEFANVDEMIITGRAITITPVQEAALSASMKTEARKVIQQSMDGFETAQSAHFVKTAMQNTKAEGLQASL